MASLDRNIICDKTPINNIGTYICPNCNTKNKLDCQFCSNCKINNYTVIKNILYKIQGNVYHSNNNNNNKQCQKNSFLTNSVNPKPSNNHSDNHFVINKKMSESNIKKGNKNNIDKSKKSKIIYIILYRL